jgi:plasmid stabilization system protein ParE
VIVRWSPSAVENLAEVSAYLEPLSSTAAHATLARIVKRATQLADFPNSGRNVEGSGDPAVREVFAVPYRIVYVLHDDYLEVVAVRHGRRSR